MNRQARVNLIIVSVFVLIAIFYLAFVIAAQAFPGGSTHLSGVGCSALNKSSSIACQGTYPGACGAAGDRIGCIDGINETVFMASNNDFAAINISYANTTVSDCGAIQQVFLCYRRSVRGGGSINNCEVSFDNANWSSKVIMNNTCPSLNTQQPVICQNITANKTWSCSNFFGSSANGSSVARVQVQQATGTSTRNLTIDALFFNVTYTSDATAPTIDFVTPTLSSGSYQYQRDIYVNVSAVDTGSTVKNITIRLYNSTRALINTTNSTSSPLFYNFTVTYDGLFFFNATTFDNSGNVNNSETRNVTIDRVAAVINFTNPSELNNGVITRNNILVNISIIEVAPYNLTINLFNSSQGLINQSNLTNSVLSSYFVNFTGIVNGTYKFNATVVDLLGSINYTETRTVYVNRTPILGALNATPNPIAGGNVISINTSGVDDPQQSTVQLFCHGTNTTPTSGNSICTGGTTTVASSPYNLNCTFTTAQMDANNTVYCRVYDGESYSTTRSVNYTTKVSTVTTLIFSVAEDTTQPYIDTANNGRTDIIVSGESGMTCRWSTNDLAYSSMTNGCTTIGSQANCSVNDVSSQGFFTRYVSCADSVGNGQTSSNNLNVEFYLDYTAPTTTDNSVSDVRVPGYGVTITESDNVDTDPKTTYCSDTTNACLPGTSIDNGGQVVFSTRGVNYLRYNSTDFAGNTQTIVSKTININQLPLFTSALDNAVTIKGGSTVNITTNSSDTNSGQNVSLFVCSSTNVTYLGCGTSNYCNATGTGNLTCVFNSEVDSTAHSWFAYIFDSLNESASTNPISGSYTTDSSAPSITIITPANASTTSTSVSLDIILSEVGNAWYNLDNNATTNVSMSNVSAFEWVASISSLAVTSHNITFYANDSYGNLANVTRYFSITPTTDTTAPAITILSPVNNSYVSGTLLINISADESLSWAGYTLNGGSLLNMTNYSLTQWYNVSLLSGEAQYNLTVYGNDSSNNQGNRSATFYLDSVAPRYSNTNVLPSPANQSQSVNCSISWSDGFNITSVIIAENSSGTSENHTISFTGTSGSASYIIIGSKLAVKGGYTCLFYATDITGNSNSTSQSFVVNDVTSPTITVTSPSNVTYNQQSIGISISTNENVSSAWYSLDNAANITMNNISYTSWNATLSSLSNGGHNITFYANDSSNNIGNTSLLRFSVNTGGADTVAPVITINTLVNNTYYTATTLGLNITANENISFAWYILNSTPRVYLSNSSMINWNATLSELGEESTDILEVYANDTASPANNGSTNITFFVDKIAPRLFNVSVYPNSPNETQNVVCNVFVNDTFSLSSVKISENATIKGVFLNHTIDLSSSGDANYTILSASRGDYTCLFYATDRAGNQNTTSTTFTVSDVTNPAISINSPQNTTYTTSSILFSITTNENVSSASYSLDGGTNSSLSGSATSWSNTVTAGSGSHNVIFYALDSSGNEGNSSTIYFSVDLSIYDTTAPGINIWSPANNSYLTSSGVLLNITADENLAWAGYKIDSGTLTNLGNTSLTGWNATVTLTEGQHNVTFYANDTSVNKNQGNRSSVFYVDLADPYFGAVPLTCTDPVNDSQNVSCFISALDSVGLNYTIVSHNATGSWQNTTLSMSGTSYTVNYNITSGNTTMPRFSILAYIYDLSGRTNVTSRNITVVDDSFPAIYNISYYPNTTDLLDPGVRVNVNATIVDNYNISTVVLMWLNQSDGNWISVSMANLTSVNTSGSINAVFNATFIPQNGTYAFKINVTDSAGNQNISENTTIIVANDTSYFNSTTIPDTKSIIYSQRVSNNTLGGLYVNNTGDDSQLNFTINISSSIRDRFNINYTSSANATYSVGAGGAINLTIFADTTSLTAGLYDYNITVSSSAGTSIIQKKLNIQTAEGPYISVSIDSYSSSVTRGQTGVTLSASVTNLGTSAAQDVDLNWTLPSEFSLASGNLSRRFSVVPIGLSSSNSITIDVSSSANVSSVNITAISTASNANSSNATKAVSITNPLTVTQTVTNTVTVTTGGGGGGAGGGAAAVVISNTIEVTRGDEMTFNVNVFNKYPNKTLEGLTLTIIGFPEKYISVTPRTIGNIGYNKTSGFLVTLTAPTYKSREEHLIQAIIRGKLVDGNSAGDYSETQNIKLIIQEVSSNETLSILNLAKKAIEQMREKTFNIIGVDKLYAAAIQSLQNKHNEEAKRIADEIVLTKNTAFAAFDLIGRLKQAMDDPKKMNLITSNVPSEFIDQSGNVKTSQSLLTGNVVFTGQSVVDLVSLAQAAFDRGDYSTALERAKNAQVMLILERKGNFGLFLYLYWYYIIAGIIIIVGLGMYGLRIYRKRNISGKINDLEKEEQNIRLLMIANQKSYLSARISSADYHKTLAQHTKRLADIQKERINLRERRIRLLPRSEVNLALEKESARLEEQIKSLQRKFYVEHKVPESEYHTQFAAFNEQLTEIEGEKIELNLKEKEEKKEEEKHGGKSEEMKNASNERHDLGKKSIFDFVKSHFKEKDLKGKYIKINVKPHDKNKHLGNKK
jgi:hypothetical protein